MSTRSSLCRSRLGAPGGAGRDRTDDLMLAKHALSQLSYGPMENSGRPGSPAERPQARTGVGASAPDHHDNGGPGTTRTSDLTLIRGAL